MMEFYEDIKTIMKMKELKSVAWKVKGEDSFRPEKTEVRFEDVEGTVFEMVVHSNTPINRIYRNQEEVILNVAFTHFGIIPSGQWIGQTTDLETMVNMCRQKARYEGNSFINEDKCVWNEFEIPVHVF